MFLGRYCLLVELESYNQKKYALYANFRIIASENSNYRLAISGYQSVSNAGD